MNTFKKRVVRKIKYIIFNIKCFFDEAIFKSYDLSIVPRGPSSNKLKQQTVLLYKKKYHIQYFIETGTFIGDMVEAVKNDFKKIFSIELDKKLYKTCKSRFKKNKNIKLYHGDSVLVLPKIFRTIDDSILFWLDAHYSGGVTKFGNQETPIMKELELILERYNSEDVILIDDARLFGANCNYPTIEDLEKKILARGDLGLKIKDDIIRISANKKQY